MNSICIFPYCHIPQIFDNIEFILAYYPFEVVPNAIYFERLQELSAGV